MIIENREPGSQAEELRDEPVEQTDMTEPNMWKREIVNPDDAMVQEIFDMEMQCYPPEMMEPSEPGITAEEELKEVLETEGVHILIEDAEGPFGHISAVDLETEREYFEKNDPDFKFQENALYINTIDIIKRRNQQEGLERPKALGMLWDEFIKQAVADGYKTAVMYAREKESRVLQKVLGAEKFRTMPNWLEMEEDFDYLELNLTPKEEKAKAE